MTDRPRILVIDDEAGMRHAVERVLGSQYTLDVCETAAAAREAAAAHTPDLALLDVRLPDGDGFELMQELLQKHPDLDVYSGSTETPPSVGASGGGKRPPL